MGFTACNLHMRNYDSESLSGLFQGYLAIEQRSQDLHLGSYLFSNMAPMDSNHPYNILCPQKGRAWSDRQWISHLRLKKVFYKTRKIQAGMWKTSERENACGDSGEREYAEDIQILIFTKKYYNCYPCHQAFWTHSCFLFLNLGMNIFKLSPKPVL